MYGVAGDYQKTANDEILVIPMIETVRFTRITGTRRFELGARSLTKLLPCHTAAHENRARAGQRLRKRTGT
jgi:hypothetical protein